MRHHVSEIVAPGTFLARLEPTREIVSGTVAVIYSRGRYRTAEITKVGRTRVHVEYVTREGGPVSRPPQPMNALWRTCSSDDPQFAGIVRQRTGQYSGRASGHYLED